LPWWSNSFAKKRKKLLPNLKKVKYRRMQLKKAQTRGKGRRESLESELVPWMQVGNIEEVKVGGSARPAHLLTFANHVQKSA
jgi:hypothetical protein